MSTVLYSYDLILKDGIFLSDKFLLNDENSHKLEESNLEYIKWLSDTFSAKVNNIGVNMISRFYDSLGIRVNLVITDYSDNKINEYLSRINNRSLNTLDGYYCPVIDDNNSLAIHNNKVTYIH